MPPTHSKPEAEQPEAAAEKRKQLQLVMSHCTINMVVSILNFTTRGEILKDLVGGDYKKVGEYMAWWTTMTAAAEFALNPTVGRLSDTYGRKPFMMLSPYAALVLKTWVLARPSVASLTAERVVCDLLRTLSGTTMGTAAVTDLVEPHELGSTLSSLWSSMGVAIIVAPLVASRLSARGTYKAAIAMALVQLYTDQFQLKETLPVSQRRPFAGVSNPFSLVRLFTASSTLTVASWVMVMHSLMDVKILADPLITLQLSALKWTREQTQQFSALLGLGLVAGKKITAVSLGKLGKHGHTTFTHAVTIAANLLLGLFPSSAMQIVHGFAGWVGDQKAHSVKEMGTNAALATGRFGKGELQGLQANLRALCVTVGPLLYASASARGARAGRPGGAFVAVACVCAVAELLHQRLARRLAADRASERGD